MSDKSGGFFSSVGRFFSVGASATKSKDGDKSNDEGTSNSSSKSSPSASPALKNILSVDNEAKIASDETSVNTSQNHRIGSRLRYLSPTALDRRTSASNGLEIDVDAVPDIFFSTPAVSTNRKRQLTELDKQILPQSFRSESVKRSRFLNRSLLEPTLNSSMNNERKMDMTWCGELTANHSPASSITNFSLLSRRSGATTNGSLSTRTQEIFKKLEGANTPAKEVQRMSMLRAGIARPEKWGSFSESKVPNGSATGTPPPPLKKAGDAIPSRIQLISKTMGMSARRAPYWTDLTRKRTSSKNGDTGSSDSMKSLNGNFATAELSSLFSLDLPAPKKTASTASTTTINSSNSRKQHASIMKGPDGKPVSRNTFKLSDDIEEVDEDSQKLPPIPTTTLQNPQPLKLAPEYAPKRGFLDDLAFSFTAPVDLVTAVGTAKTASTASSHKASESSSESNAESTEKQTSESSGNESDSEESEDSEVDVGEENGSEVKESRPQTSADTISSGSNQSSKDSSPKVAKDAEPVVVAPAPVVDAGSKKWECQSCFCSWDSTLSECGACGEARPGGSGTGPKSQPKPSEKQLVSNLSSFASNTPSTVKFGFGSGASTTTTIASTTSNTIPFGSGSSVAPLFGAPKTTAPPPTTVPATIPVAPTTIASAPVAAVTSSSNGTRVDWECPDCMVSNKASDDKCPCCSHVKYASAEASSNVFGNRAFKPLSSTGSTISFGVGGSTATTQPSAFAFGLSKTTEVAPTSTPAFGLSAKPAVSSAPVEKPSAPEVPKTAGSLFGNIAKPADSATTSFLAPGAASSTSSLAPTAGSSLFGGSTGSIFNLNKTNTTETAKPGLFGSILDKETHVTTTPVSVALPSSTDSTQSKSAIPTIAPTMSLFGNSSTGSFGGSSMFGNSKTELPKISSTLSFGNPTTAAAPVSTATAEAVKTNVFGSNSASASTSLFGAGSSSTATNLFTTKPADSTTSSIFGKPISFGDDSGTTTTDGAPAKRGLFSSDSQKLQFGGQQKVEMPKFTGFGNPASTASTTSGSLFGGASTNPPMFGGPSSSSIPAFSTSNSSSTSGFPSSTATPFGNAGTTSTSGVFGAFGNKPSQPGLSSSSSTNSLFGQAPADSSNPFGGTSNNGFNFGASSSTTGATAGGGGVFQFGNAATSAPAPTAAPGGGAFQFGGNMSVPQAPAPGGMENAFSYQAPSGVGARKMAMARRRNMRK